MDYIITYFPYLLSIISIYQMWIAGDKKPYAWMVMIGNQCLWLVWIVASGTWGFLLLNVALFIVGIRNHRLWQGRVTSTLLPTDNLGGTCGECYIKLGERCDICRRMGCAGVGCDSPDYCAMLHFCIINERQHGR